MKNITWSVEKNRALKADSDRRISFEDILAAIENGGLLDDMKHPNAAKFPHQRMFVVLFNRYVYGVPYVYDATGNIFLKTAFPSRALKRIYMAGDDDA
ncbi:toxin [Pararhizobium sp. O133]|uniref:toxin n=1 Tax=Pararhizobium sp. O133 TaxID=3449278 RepID=UPI003F68252B